MRFTLPGPLRFVGDDGEPVEIPGPIEVERRNGQLVAHVQLEQPMRVHTVDVIWDW